MKKLMVILIVLIAVSPCYAVTYYVSSTGNDLSAGSTATPWKTIQKCANTINAGDTCILKSGVYAENLVTISRSGSAFYPLNFRAEYQGRAVLNGRINITGNYVKIDGLKIVPQTSHTYGVNIKGNYNDVRNCSIDGSQKVLGTNNTAIGIIGQKNTADSNYITGTCFGIQISGQDHTVNKNEVFALTKNGSCGDVDYMRFFGTGHVITYNKFHGINLANVGTSHVDCFQTFDNNGPQYAVQNILVEGNFCSDAMEGMMMTSKTYKVANNVTIRNNIFRKCTAWGIAASAIKNVKVYNNTFDMTGGIHGMGCAVGSSCEFRNNIFYNGRSSYWFDSSATIINGTAAAPGKNNILYRSGKLIKGYADDVINKDPQFIDPDNNNYKLKSTSPAVKLGVPVAGWSPATDKDGQYRPQTTWSAGAYETFPAGKTVKSGSNY